MPDNTNTVKITLQFSDDGTIKIVDQAKGKIGELGETTEQASAKGTSGLRAMKAGWLELAAGVTAGYFAIKKGLGIVTDLVNVAAEAEQIEKRAAFQIETWGYKFQEIKPYVDAFAESIQKTTRFSSDMARQGLGQMMQYTSSVEKGMKGVQLAMGFATQNHLDLESAIRLVGMGIEGNVEPLGRYVLELKNLDKVLGENATSAEKSAYFFELFNKKFGGAPQADLKTYAGQLNQLRNEWDDLKKAIGEALMPSAEEWVAGTQSILMGASSWVIPTIEKLKKERQNLEDWLAYGMEGGGASEKYIEGYKRRIDEVTVKIEKLENVSKAAADAQKKAAEQAAKIKVIDIAPRDPERWKKWAEEFDGVTYALEQLGIKSTAILSKEATDALRYAEVIKKAFQEKKASVSDYINALNLANDAMKKLTGEDISKRKEEAWDKNAETIKGISKDEEGWLKKVDKANEELFKTLKDLEKLKVPTHADVGPMEREVNAMKEKLRAEGLVIPVTTEGATGAGGGGGESPTMTDYMTGKIPFLQGGKSGDVGGGDIWDVVGENWYPKLDEAEKSWNDFKNELSVGASGVISFYGIGSTKKPITEKIQEIIAEFGGLEKALQGIEAEIKVAELSMEYQKLETKLKQIERILPDMSAIASASGGSPYVGGAIVQTVKDLTAEYTEQMKILQMKMDYQMLRAYGGSYQTGTNYVPQTGLYMLHEGEQVAPQNYSFGNIPISVTINGVGSSPEDLVRVFKYSLAGELTDAIRKALSARSRSGFVGT